MAISSPQYVWALFTQADGGQAGASLSRSSRSRSRSSSSLQTFLAPVQGFLVEKFGPQATALARGRAHRRQLGARRERRHLPALYLTYGLLGGIGTGIIYIGVIGLMVKWFPGQARPRDRPRRGRLRHGRGAHHVSDLDRVLRASGYQHTLVVFGLILARSSG